MHNRTYNSSEDVVIYCTVRRIASLKGMQVARLLSTLLSHLLPRNGERLELVADTCPLPDIPDVQDGETPFQPSQSLLNGLWKSFSALITTPPGCKVTMIIDAIDDIQLEEERQLFLRNLIQLRAEVMSRGVGSLKIFTTARPYNDIREALDGFLTINKDKERERESPPSSRRRSLTHIAPQNAYRP